MAKPLVTDALWRRIEPLLPPSKPRRRQFPGRKPIDDRRVVTGILFVLKTGIPWEALPREMGCGSGMTCWRRMREWMRAGVWPQVRETLLAEIESARRNGHPPSESRAEETDPTPSSRRELPPAGSFAAARRRAAVVPSSPR